MTAKTSPVSTVTWRWCMMSKGEARLYWSEKDELYDVIDEETGKPYELVDLPYDLALVLVTLLNHWDECHGD